MAETLYNSLRWRTVRARAVERDGGRCTVSRLLGGQCAPAHRSVHAHHIVPVSEGGAAFDIDNVATACEVHHPMWEALRRVLVARLMEEPPRCTHQHPSSDARQICERRLRRAWERTRGRASVAA